MFYKIINEDTKQVQVGLGTDTNFYESIGMVDGEVEKAYNGNWYLKGYTPQRPLEQAKEERIKELKYNCSEYIFAEYPVFKQLNAANNIAVSEEEIAEMKNFINNVRNSCNSREIQINNCTTLEEINDISTTFENTTDE